MSIDKRRLYDELVALVTESYFGWDKDILLYLIRIYTFTNPVERAVNHTPPTEWRQLPPEKSLVNLDWFLGLAIGNLPSQIDANFYNAPFVRWLRAVGLIPDNYVDDFGHVFTDKEAFLTAMPHVRNYLQTERGLTLHPSKFYMQPAWNGIKFLGGYIKGFHIYINNRTVSRCYMKIHWYNTVIGTKHKHRARNAEHFASILNSYLGQMSHFATYNIRRGIAEEVLSVWSGYLSFNPDYTTATPARKYTALGRARCHAWRDYKRDIKVVNFYRSNYGNKGNTPNQNQCAAV